VQDTADNDSVAVVVNAGRVILAKPSTTAIHALGGTSTVNAGVLQLGGTGSDQLFYGMQLRLNGGLLDLNGFNGVVSTLVSETPTVAGTVANNGAGVSTLTVGGNANGGNGNSTFFGQFVDNTNGGAGQLRLEKDGTGTFNLATAAGHTGGTVVTRGTLNIGANGYVGSLVGAVDVASGATLGLNRMDDVLFANVVTGAGNLAVNGSGKVTVAGANTYATSTASISPRARSPAPPASRSSTTAPPRRPSPWASATPPARSPPTSTTAPLPWPSARSAPGP
jgi:autotransporter-associated beta strand protein